MCASICRNQGVESHVVGVLYHDSVPTPGLGPEVDDSRSHFRLVDQEPGSRGCATREQESIRPQTTGRAEVRFAGCRFENLCRLNIRKILCFF